MKGLRGATVVVAGGAGELGRAVATDLCDRGAHVMVADLDVAAASDVAGRLSAATSHRLDVTDASCVQEVLDAAPGRLAAVVVTAAVYAGLSRLPVTEVSAERWRRVLDINVRGSAVCGAVACAHLADRGGGQVVLVSSTTATQGAPGLVDYAASKGAVQAVARSLAVAWGGRDVRVNCVVPGPLATRGTTEALGPGGEERVTSGQLVPGLQSAEDLAGTIAFLSSREAPYLTGQSIVVDGGKSRS